MATVMVLGGGGAVGSVAVKVLSSQSEISEVRVGEIRPERAQEVAKSLEGRPVVPITLDVEDDAALTNALSGCDVILNCVGPYYKNVRRVVERAIAQRVHYVDVCDDPDATLSLLELDEEAKAAGVSVLIGMGNSPGATNLLARFASEHLLEETDSIDIFHAHGGEPVEGPGVIGHRFHCMSIDIPMYLEGTLKHVGFFREDGLALRRTFDFPVLGDGIAVYPYPHPEQLTLPRYLKVKQVTNRGTVLPPEYYQLTLDLCRLGLSSYAPLEVDGVSVIPHQFSIAYLLQERERILKETQFGPQRGCSSVVVRGRQGGEAIELRFHMASRDQALGEGTGIPAAVGVLLMLAGRIPTTGVFPPEGGVDPLEFITRARAVLSQPEFSSRAEQSFGGVVVEQLREGGPLVRFVL